MRTLAICLPLALGAPVAHAESAALADKELAVRAAFLFRLAFFVNWPEAAFATPAAPVVFCISDDSAQSLPRLLTEQTKTRSVRGRPVRVRTLVSDQDTSGCHILYSNSARTTNATGSTVVVVDSLDGLANSGVFALVLEERAGTAKLQFYAHRKRLKRLGISISAQLMQLVKFYEPAS